MEPFSTSAFKVLIWIFATTTKICNRDSSTQAHAKGFYTKCPHALLLISASYLICTDGWVSAIRFSAINFQG